MSDDFHEFLKELDPDYLRCGEVADQSTKAMIRAATRCKVDPRGVAFCMWANLTHLLSKSGWTDTQIVAMVYHVTTDKVKDDNEDKQ